MTGSGARPAPAAPLRVLLDAPDSRLHGFIRHVSAFEVIGSTNDEAGRLAAAGAPEGTLVVADAQTAGRGRSGRSWFSPAGAGLYCSIVLRPGDADPKGPAPWVRLITLAAGVAAADGIRAATGLPVELKWPNDVVLCDGAGPRAADRRPRKVAGILAEASAVSGAVQHVIVGMGINVQPAAYPREIADRATSLEGELGRPVDRVSVLVETLSALRTRYDDLRGGRGADVLSRWRDLSPTAAGALVALASGGTRRQGTTCGLDERGALLVRTAGGVEAVVSGEVEWG